MRKANEVAHWILVVSLFQRVVAATSKSLKVLSLLQFWNGSLAKIPSPWKYIPWVEHME